MARAFSFVWGFRASRAFGRMSSCCSVVGPDGLGFRMASGGRGFRSVSG